jgi:peptidyl-prolyl cis-trans isomerase SurA
LTIVSGAPDNGSRFDHRLRNETMNAAMHSSTMSALVVRLLAAAVFAASLAVSAQAQVVVVANGSPITELDIQQRGKLVFLATHKQPTRTEIINQLIDDRIKIAKAKSYGFEMSDEEVNTAFANMAQRQHMTAQQFTQMLDHAGITAGALKARIKADLTWQQMVRSRYQSSLHVGESDVALALRSQKEDTKDAVGYVYTLYPVVVIVTGGSSQAAVEEKRREAENLRSRFASCSSGLVLARALRDVAVREPITRSSADLPPPMRALLASMEVGHLTAPDVTPQGLQMFAVCGKRESAFEAPIKKELREQIFNKRFEAESKKFLEEIRKQAMIEYK